MEYALLSDCLKALMKTFKDVMLKAQERVYPVPTGKGRRHLTQDQFGCNHPNPLRLLKEEDGWDGEPVGDLDVKSARNYFDKGGYHQFPKMQVLVRAAVFFHLDFFFSVFLILKGEWERFFAHEEMGYRTAVGDNLEEILNDAEAAKLKQPLFEPDLDAMFDLFEAHGQQAGRMGYDRQTFKALVKEMILQDLHLKGTDSPELARFIDGILEERERVEEGTPEQQEGFWIKKCCWIEMQEKLGEYLLLVENQRVKNANVYQRYLGIFCVVEIELRKAISRKKIAEMRLAVKREHPDLNLEALDLEVEQEVVRRQQELEELEKRAEQARIQVIDEPRNGVPMDQSKASEYRKECKKVLRELWHLLYPDKLFHHPAWPNLTEAQKAYLGELLNKTLEIKDHHLHPHPELWEYENAPLVWLQDALAKARAVLENAGLDVNVEVMIQGETIEEQLAWLEKAIERLEGEIIDLQARLKALAEDPDFREKEAILNAPDKYDAVKAEMQKKTEVYHHEADALESELEMLFGEVPA